jgi:oligoxyloglucan reducing-end-specific cellobiohydrolase
VFDPRHSDTIYAGTYTDNSIYRSTDDGASWAPLPGQPLTWPYAVPSGTRAPSANRALVNPDGQLYVTFGDQPGPNTMNYGLVMKFNPADGSWTDITPPVNKADGQSAPRGGFVGLTGDPNQPGVVAVSTFDRWYPVDTIYVTRDGGLSWVDLGHITSSGGVDGNPPGLYYMDPSVFSIAPWLTFGDTSSPLSPTPTARFGWWISALLLDPTNPEHLMFATGATIYATDNLSAAFAGTSPSWYVQALGVEETAVLALISPTDGAHLLSGVGDIGGFRHDDFKAATQMFTNPVATTVGSMDWAGQNPSMIARVQNPGSISTSPCNSGALSSDGGVTWTPFGACAAGGNSGNGGVIAIDASGTTLMWTPPAAQASQSTQRPSAPRQVGRQRRVCQPDTRLLPTR